MHSWVEPGRRPQPAKLLREISTLVQIQLSALTRSVQQIMSMTVHNIVLLAHTGLELAHDLEDLLLKDANSNLFQGSSEGRAPSI